MYVAYVVKRYPRYSETFIVNEILAHEAAGMRVRIYALLPPQDSHFQDIISQVKAPVCYLSAKAERATPFWELQKRAAAIYPNSWQVLSQHQDASAREITQALELALHIHKHQIDHLHAHFATTSTTVTNIAAQICQIPFSFTAHAKDIFHQDNDYNLVKKKFSSAQFAVTVSDYNVDYLINELEIEPSKLVRIYNGLDLNQFPFSPYNNRPPHIIAVGRLVEKKGFSDLIHACALLKQRGTIFHCDIIGEGDQKRQLADLIKNYHLGSCVHLIGPLPQAQVKRRICESAMFVAPCVIGTDNNQDGLPTVLVESMALGTPCISTDVTGIPEVIEHNKTGLMCEQHSPEDLAAAISQLLSSPEQAEKYAQNARMQIEQRFNIHSNTEILRKQFLKFQ